jgi:hypothetical protein
MQYPLKVKSIKIKLLGIIGVDSDHLLSHFLHSSDSGEQLEVQ